MSLYLEGLSFKNEKRAAENPFPFRLKARIVDLNFIGHENEQMTRNGTFLKNLQIPAALCSRRSIRKSSDSNGSWIGTWTGYYHAFTLFFLSFCQMCCFSKRAKQLPSTWSFMQTRVTINSHFS
jgi:hypothetical protein